jgi:hypothetical protein
MKTLKEINPRIKEILGQAVFSGMEKGLFEVSNNKIYSVGVGIDIKQRVINANVGYALKNTILASGESTISAKNDTHSTGHSLRITHDRFIIYPKRVDYMSQEWDDEAYYHKKLMANNPTKQGDLFDTNDQDNPIFVQLLFGKKGKGFFAVLRIPDSSGGVYDEEEIKLPSVATLAPEEKVRTPKKLYMRSKKASGQ